MCATVSWGAHESFIHPIFVLKNGCDKLDDPVLCDTVPELAVITTSDDPIDEADC
jgi:hypothetical protein